MIRVSTVGVTIDSASLVVRQSDQIVFLCNLVHRDKILVGTTMLAIHSALADRSRLVPRSAGHDAASVRDVAALVGCGLVAAAAVTYLDFNLKLPGHAILRSVIPMSLGLALVPRRGAGIVMSGAALIGLLGFSAGGASVGTGATTSLLAIGPLLDLAGRLASRGPWLFAAFGLAGLLTNLLAFVVRAAMRMPGSGGGMGGGTGRGGGAGWWSIAPVSYFACGLAAGVLCALIWFRWSGRNTAETVTATEPS